MSYNNDSDVALQCRNFGYALVNYFFVITDCFKFLDFI